MKNPPAYPALEYPVIEAGEEIGVYANTTGMTLLDWFAGLAMQGMSFSTLHGSGSEEFFREQIRMAYKVARAMLEERDKPENQL